MARIDVESKRVGDGLVISAHVKDWELMQSFPRAIAGEIVDAIVTRLIEEQGEAIMAIVKDEGLIAVALEKEIAFRLRKLFADKHERENPKRS